MLKMMTSAAMLAGTMLAVSGLASPALAADNAMQVCGAKYQAAKAGKTLPAGQTWPQYLSSCRASLTKTPAAAAAIAGKAPASASGKAAATPKAGSAQASAAQLAARSRQKECAAKYQVDKTANKLAGQSWPKYYSACAAKLKG